MENQMLSNIQQNIMSSALRPAYADEAVVMHTIKTSKNSEGKIVKEGHMHIIFVDMTTQKPIDKVVVSPITAAGLVKALSESLVKLDAELKNKKIEKARKKVEIDYIR